MNVQNLNETQKAAVNVAQILTQVTGVNYEFFESSQDEQGKYVGENGSHNRNTNTIRIDINAGMKGSTEGNNIMIVTLAHELTHYIESLSPNQYAKLQEFAFEKLSETTGQDIHELIHIEENRIKRSRAKNELAPFNKRELTEKAKSELVARSFEGMLTDAKAVKQLAQQDVGLFNKLKNKVMEFISKIEKACRELLDKDGKYKKGTVSKEARTLQKYAKEMRELWMDALKDAGENQKGNQKADDIENLMRFRENEYFQKIIPCTRDEALSLKMADDRNVARYRDEIDGVFDGTLQKTSKVLVGMPSETLLSAGLPNNPITISQNVARKIAYPEKYKIGNTDMKGKHNLGISILKNLIYQINSPMAITKNTDNQNKKNEGIVVWTNWKNRKGESIICVIRIDLNGNVKVGNNVVTTFNAHNDYAKQFINDTTNILYTKNNKDINTLLTTRRYMPSAKNDDTLIQHNIHNNIKNSNKLFSMRQEDAGDNVKRVEAYGNEYVYSDRESFDEQVDNAINGKIDRYNSLYVCDTPQILLDIGLKQLPMLYTKKHLLNAVKKKNDIKHQHGLTIEQIKQIPEIVKAPAIIMDSLSRNDSIVLISDVFDDFGQPIIASIKVNGYGVYEFKKVDSNFITSVYGKKGIVGFIDAAVKQDKILYIDNKKSQNLFSFARVQFPRALNKYDFDTILHQSNYVVNNDVEDDGVNLLSVGKGRRTP